MTHFARMSDRHKKVASFRATFEAKLGGTITDKNPTLGGAYARLPVVAQFDSPAYDLKKYEDMMDWFADVDRREEEILAELMDIDGWPGWSP